MMIRSLGIYTASGMNPYLNIAVEQYLLETATSGRMVMYLWSNDRTVVVGRNQNIWNECDVSLLRAEGGFPVRRLSGGGAVYHDGGNINFTFVSMREDYDVDRQNEVVLRAVRSLGIDASRNGRNDLCVDSRKFSGHSFYQSGGRCFHNGTILIRTDVARMERYLSVSREKLEAKGVRSVRSRVVNLSEIDPSITREAVLHALERSLEEVYGLPAERMSDSELDMARVLQIREMFVSEEWLYTKAANFTHRISERFPWGGAELMLDVREGRIAHCAIYTDSLETDVFDRIREAMTGCQLLPGQIAGRLAGTALSEPQQRVAEDIAGMIAQEFFM